MTDFTWDGGGDAVAWSDPDNWDVGSGFPDDNGDRAIFDATGDSVVTEAARTIGEIQMNSGFTGSVTQTVGSLTIDDAGAHNGGFTLGAGTFDANDLDITIDGDANLDGGTAVMGAGSIWTVGGNWDSNSSITLTEETSTVKMIGTSKTINGGTSSARQLPTVEIDTGATVSTAGSFRPTTLTVNGTLTINGGIRAQVTVATTVGSSGSITGAGELRASAGGTMSVGSGSIDVAVLRIEGNATINPGTYDSATVDAVPSSSGARTLTFASGTFIFVGNVNYTANSSGTATYTVDKSTNNPNVTYNGNLTFDEPGTGFVAYNGGTGTITFGGTALQTVTTIGEDLKDISITNVSAGGVTFADALDADKITADTTSGNVLAKFDETGAHTIDEFDRIGAGSNVFQLRSEVDANQWDVTTVGDQAVTQFDVKDSNMSGGAYTVTSGTDSGNNSANWTFVANLVNLERGVGRGINRGVLRGALT